MERTVLSSEISARDLRGASMKLVGIQGVEISETVRRMEESIPQVIVLLEAAVERCISFIGGSEADELVLALDDIILQYISSLQENLKSLRAVCGVDPNNFVSKKDMAERKDGGSQARKVDLASNEEEWSFVQGALQILTVSDCLTSRCSVFEASLRATLSRLSTNLSLSAFGSGLDKNQLHVFHNGGNEEFSMVGKAALDVAVVRLANVPEKARKIFNLLEQSKDPRFLHYLLLLRELLHLQMQSMSLFMMSLSPMYVSTSMMYLICRYGLRLRSQLLSTFQVLVHTHSLM